MSNIGRCGIPFLGCISLSSGLWVVIILGGVEAIQALKYPQESKIVRNMDQSRLNPSPSPILPELKTIRGLLKDKF